MTTYAIKFVVEDAVGLDEPCKTILVSFAESGSSMYRFIQSGALTMPDELWKQLADNLRRGSRRTLPIFVEGDAIFVEGDAG